jgi:hypothetical protein
MQLDKETQEQTDKVKFLIKELNELSDKLCEKGIYIELDTYTTQTMRNSCACNYHTVKITKVI